MQIQPKFRRNPAPHDVTGDVWEQKGIPLSSCAIRALQLWKLLKPSTKLLPPLFFFFSLLKSNLYNPISGPYATAHLGSSRRVTAVSLQPPRAPAGAEGASVEPGMMFGGRWSCTRQGFLPAALVALADPGFTPVLGVLRGAGCWRLPWKGLLQETGLLTRVAACGDLASSSFPKRMIFKCD